MHPSRRIAGLVATLLTSVLAFSLLPTTAPSAAAQPRAERAAVLLRLLSPGVVTISPGHAGSHRVAKVRYRLAKAARVKVTLVRAGTPRRVLDVNRLGRQARGRHVYRWDGRQPGVGRLPDGAYVLELRAQRPGHPGSTAVTRSLEVTIDTTAPGFTWESNRDVVYPRTTLFTDRISVLVTGEPEFADLSLPDSSAQTTDAFSALILRSDGSLVRDLRPQSVPCDYARDDDGVPICLTASWDGHMSSGGLAPAGDYRLRVTSTDSVGNRTVSEQPVSVSDAPLVERTRTVTAPPGEFSPSTFSCRVWVTHCGEGVCQPVASQRFPGGLSYAACARDDMVPFSDFGILGQSGTLGTQFLGETGHERYQVSVTGGRATSGAGSVTLLVRGRHIVNIIGDGTFSLPEMRVMPEQDLDVTFLPSWSILGASEGAWDVATITLTFTDFVPAA